jgi:hypothetical protein
MCFATFSSFVAAGGLTYLVGFHLLITGEGISTLEYLHQRSLASSPGRPCWPTRPIDCLPMARYPDKIPGYAEKEVAIELADLGPPPSGSPPMPAEWLLEAPPAIEEAAGGGHALGSVWSAEIHVACGPEARTGLGMISSPKAQALAPAPNQSQVVPPAPPPPPPPPPPLLGAREHENAPPLLQICPSSCCAPSNPDPPPRRSPPATPRSEWI